MATTNLILVAFVRPQPVGVWWLRHREDWPFHITLVPWFSGTDLERLSRGLERLALRLAPQPAVIGQHMNFGLDNEVSVHSVDDIGQLAKLHEQLLALVRENDGRLESEKFIGTNYHAHVTEHKTGNFLCPGDEVTIDGFSLVTRHKKADKQFCEVVQNFRLGAS